MPDPSDPVSPDEYVLRRIPNVMDRVDPRLPIPVSFVAFRPETADVDGLSLYRELFVTAERVAKAGPNPKGYFVARLKVVEILAIDGLSILPTPDLGGPLPGHASIPELTPSANKGAKKHRAREQMLELAKLASRDIPYSPIP